MSFQSNPNIYAAGFSGATRSKLYDVTQLERLSLGNDEFIRKMVSIFLHQTPMLLAQIDLALEACDFHRVSICSYKIKTSIDTLGIQSVVGIVRRLEMVKSWHSGETEIRNLVMNLHVGLELVMSELRRDFHL